MINRSLQVLAKAFPFDVNGDKELQQALRFLDSDLSTKTVIKAGYVTAFLTCMLLTPLVHLVPTGHQIEYLIGILLIAIVAGQLIFKYPLIMATLQRTTALGTAPALIGRAILRMRIDPSEETAVAFAAKTGNDRLSKSLSKHINRAAGEPGSGLDTFAKEWQQWFPALGRAAQLLGTAGSAPPAQRERALNRALSAVLNGTSGELRAFVTNVNGPATALYAFGVLIPLALVAVLPGAHAAGVTITMPVIVLIYNVILPVALLSASVWLLLRRPVAFPPPQVTEEHLDKTRSKWYIIGLGVCTGGAAGAVSKMLIGLWTVPISVTGIGVGSTLVLWYRPHTKVRDKVREVEAGLPDALYLIGRQVDEGTSVERSIAEAGKGLQDETGKLLTDAARRQEVLAVGIREALLGEQGALTQLPSRRTKNLASLLSIASKEGQPAGHAIVAMADHLDELQSVEQEARHELAKVTNTLTNTAAIFGPLVAGSTVALAEGMHTFGEGEDIQTIAVSELGLAIGGYVLLLAVVLVGLSTTLKHGLDRPTIGYGTGGTLISATTVFFVAYYGTELLL